MIQLMTCTRCNGFLSFALRACPHCGAQLDRARQVILAIAGLTGGGAISMTLMACYGPACVDESDSRCGNPGDDAAADARIDGRETGDAGDGG